jgi:outer membrane receptor for ferrienterochelin and colicins
MKAPFTRALLPALIWAFSAATYAESKSATPLDVYNLSLAELGQVQISIATGNSTPLDKAPATASVIYAAQIEAMGARTLDDVLETVPGMHISLSALSRLDSVESIRGIHTGFNPQVLMMLNGVPVQFSTPGGRPALFKLPVANIDRVEVIRGPGSAIYGADAYAGVVNVITKDAVSIEHTKIGTRIGSFNSREVWLQTATEWKGIGIAFDASYQDSAGDSSRKVNSDLQSTLDTAFGTKASLAPGSLSTRYQVLDSHLAISTNQLQFNLWNWRSTDAGVGAGAAQALDPTGRDDSNLWMADVTYHFQKNDSNWENSIRWSHLYYDEIAQFTLLPAGAIVPIGADGNVDFAAPVGAALFTDGLKGRPGGVTKDTKVDFISIYSGFDSHRIRLNIGTRAQNASPRESKNFGPGVLDSIPLPSIVNGSLTDVTGTPYVFLVDKSRTVNYLSLQDEWHIAADLDLTAGVRYDDYSDFGNTTNPRIALVWAASEKLTTKLLLGSAFRAPSFSELHFKNNPVSLGNPDIQPEKINSEELSFNYRPTATFQTTLTLFTYQAKKMIDFIPDAGATIKLAQNSNSQDGKGFEWEINWKPAQSLQLGMSYSHQDAIDTKTDRRIPDAPGEQIKANLNWLLAKDWSLNSQVGWVSDRERPIGDLRAPVKDYTLLNVALNRKNLLPNMDMQVAIRNATNADAREPSSGTIPDDYPLESRSFWLGLTYAFK